MWVTPYDIAERFIGLKEVPGSKDNPQILAMLQLDHDWPEHDEVPWCSGFLNYPFWLLRLPRSKSLLARSWLQVGQAISLYEAEKGSDIVILKRGGGDQPGPENLTAPGHVGFFSGHVGKDVYLLGGNQADTVSVVPFPVDRVIGVRRIRDEG